MSREEELKMETQSERPCGRNAVGEALGGRDVGWMVICGLVLQLELGLIGR